MCGHRLQSWLSNQAELELERTWGWVQPTHFTVKGEGSNLGTLEEGSWCMPRFLERTKANTSISFSHYDVTMIVQNKHMVAAGFALRLGKLGGMGPRKM